jgi:hypothetical protein
MKEYFYFRNGRLYRVEKVERETFLECSFDVVNYLKSKLALVSNKQTLLKNVYSLLIAQGAKVKE